MAALKNRPLKRYAIRPFLSLIGGRRWAHRQDWWPGLRLELPRKEQQGQAFYKRRQVCDLLPLSGLSAAKDEITIIGSGPSIDGQRFAGLPARSTILLNGAIHLLDARIEEPLAIIVEDERFVWRHFALMLRLIKPGTPCLFSTSVLRTICEIDSAWLRKPSVHHIDFLQKPYGAPRRSLREIQSLPFVRSLAAKPVAISLDPVIGVTSGGSVATTAIQMALWLKPKKIGLAGIDIANAHQPRFYETSGQSAKSLILQAQDRIKGMFELAFAECRERQIELVNYSPISALSSLGIPYDGRLSGDL